MTFDLRYDLDVQCEHSLINTGLWRKQKLHFFTNKEQITGRTNKRHPNVKVFTLPHLFWSSINKNCKLCFSVKTIEIYWIWWEKCHFFVYLEMYFKKLFSLFLLYYLNLNNENSLIERIIVNIADIRLLVVAWVFIWTNIFLPCKFCEVVQE